MIKSSALFACLLLSFSSLAEQQSWYFIRHFEKQQGADPHLTALGKQRAQALIAALEGKSIKQIYSTQYHRTLESITPLAAERGLEIIIYDPSKLELLAEQISDKNNILIAGHSNTTPQLIRLLGGEVADLDDHDFGQLFILTKQYEQHKLAILNIEIK